MHLNLAIVQLFAAFIVQWSHAQQGNPESDPYVPVYAECPQNLSIRNTSDGLSDEEKSWRTSRAKHILSSLNEYLTTVNISGLDVKNYMKKVNESIVPIVGMSISGGGTQSGIGGLGIWQAYDSRYPSAVAARTGGLTQLLSYITGLSGGGAVTVSLLATNNFGTIEDIQNATNFSSPYEIGPTGNETAFFETIFENAGAKAESGFPVSVADTFGQFWGSWLPQNWTYANFSDVATLNSAFASGSGPMPIITLAEVVPGKSPEIGKILYPGVNSTNGFNLTSYEVTPFEFGSWLGGRVQGFIPLQWLGTEMNNGTAQNTSQCVKGFDKLTFIQGSTTDAFAAWFIDDFYGVAVFAKRDGTAAFERRQSGSNQTDDIPIPQSQDQSPLVQLVNQTAYNFQQSFNDSIWATYPNPFEDYNHQMNGVSQLLLVDGSLSGENNPIRPLIIPERHVDFIIVYEASSEGTYAWVNGTSLQNTARSASQGKIPFPVIPSVDTMIAKNFTSQPTFFGCNGSSDTPLVLYLPNSPWSGYSNFSYRMSSFTNQQLNATLDNAFQLATYGNGTIDTDWPACLACAVIKGSMKRAGIETPDQCTRCFSKHCWNGEETKTKPREEELNLRPRLNSSLTFQEWNTTVWGATSSGQPGGSGNGSNGTAGGSGNKGGAAFSNGTPLGVAFYMAMFASSMMLFG